MVTRSVQSDCERRTVVDQVMMRKTESDGVVTVVEVNTACLMMTTRATSTWFDSNAVGEVDGDWEHVV
jgi:hypothetical protein